MSELQRPVRVRRRNEGSVLWHSRHGDQSHLQLSFTRRAEQLKLRATDVEGDLRRGAQLLPVDVAERAVDRTAALGSRETL